MMKIIRFRQEPYSMRCPRCNVLMDWSRYHYATRFVEMRLLWPTDYRNMLLRKLLDDGRADMLDEITKPMSNMKQSEMEEYARRLLIDWGVLDN